MNNKVGFEHLYPQLKTWSYLVGILLACLRVLLSMRIRRKVQTNILGDIHKQKKKKKKYKPYPPTAKYYRFIEGFLFPKHNSIGI